METKINNTLIPDFFLDWMEHWSSKQVKAMIYAARDYSKDGTTPDFGKFEEKDQEKMMKHFELFKKFIDEAHKTYIIKAKTFNKKMA